MDARRWRLLGSCLIAAVATVVLSLSLDQPVEVLAAPNPPEGQVQALCASGASAVTQTVEPEPTTVVLATTDVETETVLVMDGSGSGCSSGHSYCTGAWARNVAFASNYLRSVFGVTITLGVYSDTVWFSEPTQDYGLLIGILAGWPMPDVGDSYAGLAMDTICSWGRTVRVLWLTDNGVNQSSVNRCSQIERLDVLSPVGTPDVDVTGDADTSAGCTSWPCFLDWAPAIEANGPGPSEPWVLEEWVLESNCPTPTYRLWVGNLGGTMPDGVSDGNYVWLAGNGAKAELVQVVPPTLTLVVTDAGSGDYWGDFITEFTPTQHYMATQFEVSLRQVGRWVSQLQALYDQACPNMAQTSMHDVAWCPGYPVPIVTGPVTVPLASAYSWDASASLPPSHTTMWRMAYGPFNASNWWESDWGTPCHSAQGDVWRYVTFPSPGIWTPHVWVRDTTNNLVTVEPFQVEVICTDPHLQILASSEWEVGRPHYLYVVYDEGAHLDLLWDDGETQAWSTRVYTQPGQYTIAVTGTDDCDYEWLTSKMVDVVVKDYNLKITINGNGTVIKNPDNDNYHYGDSVTLTGVPVIGWSFAGWSGDLTGNTNPATFTIAGDTTITASFVEGSKLTITTSGQGIVTVDPPGPTYDEGTTVTLTAVPTQGWTFVSWSGDLTGNANPATITMDSNKSVTASFRFLVGLPLVMANYEPPCEPGETQVTIEEVDLDTRLIKVQGCRSEMVRVYIDFFGNLSEPSGYQPEPDFRDRYNDRYRVSWEANLFDSTKNWASLSFVVKRTRPSGGRVEINWGHWLQWFNVDYHRTTFDPFASQ